MQVELHSLLGGVVLALSLLFHGNGYGLQHHVAVEAIQIKPPLYP